MKATVLLAISTMAVALSGCAQRQFVKGHGLAPSETVKVTTLPDGARAQSNYGQSCQTPCYIPLLREKGGEITISLEGCHTERFQITSSVSERHIVRRSSELLTEAVDPDPIGVGLSALANILDGAGGVKELNTKDIDLTLIKLEDGEEDLLAEATYLTDERIPIDLEETQID